jgi:hypothetical protein
MTGQRQQGQQVGCKQALLLLHVMLHAVSGSHRRISAAGLPVTYRMQQGAVGIASRDACYQLVRSSCVCLHTIQHTCVPSPNAHYGEQCGELNCHVAH